MEGLRRLDKLKYTDSTKSERQHPVRARFRLVMALCALVILGLFARSASGQSYQTSTGTPSFSAPVPVELGFVDAFNGNLHLSIPLGSYPQRGTLQPEQITLQYDSNIWSVGDNGSGPQWIPNNGP